MARSRRIISSLPRQHMIATATRSTGQTNKSLVGRAESLTALKIDSYNWYSVIETLLKYADDHNINWERTKKDLYTEWLGHSLFYAFDESARNIDFDYNERDKSVPYFIEKAISRGRDKMEVYFK